MKNLIKSIIILNNDNRKEGMSENWSLARNRSNLILFYHEAVAVEYFLRFNLYLAQRYTLQLDIHPYKLAKRLADDRD